MPSITLRPGDISVEAERGSSLLQVIQRAGIPLVSICGGRGICGKCRVVVVSGADSLDHLTTAELRLLSPRDIERNVRLACQARITGAHILVYVPEESLITPHGRSIAPITLRDNVFPLNPAVKKIYVKLSKPTLKDNRSDFERLRETLAKQAHIPVEVELTVPLGVLRELPTTLRSSNWNVTVVLRGNELVSIEPDDTTSQLYGVAIDIGTSKIIAHLVDLNSGMTLAEDFLENPQLAYGADILSRIVYAEKSRENLIKLQELLISAINKLIRDLSERARVDQRDIYEVVVVGNTVMHHLFFRIQPSFIARSPYVPAISSSLKCRARELGVEINEHGYIYSLPVIGAFVGADAVADILATQMYKLDEPVLTVDIGINTEVLLGNSEIILATSAPAGPAFEGFGITHGMRATPGAIWSIRINNSDVEYETIGGVKPRGICGSGLVDLVAELYRNGIIDSLGRFTAVNHPRVRRDRGLWRFIVVPAEESATGMEIYVTLRDIETILLAIAAIKTAWIILSRRLRVDPSEIRRVYVAGSFGAGLNIDNAIEVELLPSVNKNRVVFVGESAIVGAKIALKSLEARREIEGVVKSRVKYIELSADLEFREVYTKSIRIGSVKRTKNSLEKYGGSL